MEAKQILIFSYLLRTPDNSGFFSISLEGSSYRESTVKVNSRYTMKLLYFTLLNSFMLLINMYIKKYKKI